LFSTLGFTSPLFPFTPPLQSVDLGMVVAGGGGLVTGVMKLDGSKEVCMSGEGRDSSAVHHNNTSFV